MIVVTVIVYAWAAVWTGLFISMSHKGPETLVTRFWLCAFLGLLWPIAFPIFVSDFDHEFR
jgi:hypothetical protein